MVPIGYDYRFDALSLRCKRGWGAVHIAAGNHQHAISAQSVVTGKNVGREEGARDVAEVRFAICIWPRNRDEN